MKYRSLAPSFFVFITVRLSLLLCLILFTSLLQTQAQSTASITLTLGQDQIGVIRTAPRLSTRISFHEPVKEIICGDLYDATTGVGSFVIQRSDNDVFIKPITLKGMSNMFVKMDGTGERIYNFTLLIGPVEQAHLIVNIVPPAGKEAKPIKSAAPILRLPVIPQVRMDTEDYLIAKRIISVQPAFLPIQMTAEPSAPTPALYLPSRSQEPLSLGTPTRQIEAVYPEYAKPFQAEGEVIVLITVDEKGTVDSAQALSGHRVLREAAVFAAKGWKFSPLPKGSEGRKRTGTIHFQFSKDARTQGAPPRTSVSIIPSNKKT